MLQDFIVIQKRICNILNMIIIITEIIVNQNSDNWQFICTFISMEDSFGLIQYFKLSRDQVF